MRESPPLENKPKKAFLPPRFLIASPQGCSGKTILTIALCGIFSERGFKIQPFKKGPDYIDPSWLSAASGRSCHNLDAFLMSEDILLSSFQRACKDADLAIIEGNMGLYDGFEPDGRGSSAELARLLGCPIILIVNAARMTRSIAALINGYLRFEPNTNIAGVVLNNVSGSRHEKKLLSAVREYCGIPVLGVIPRDPDLQILQRHLGLIPFREMEGAMLIVERICHRLKSSLNLDGILTIAQNAEKFEVDELEPPSTRGAHVRIGVILDKAFNFYYPENLEALRCGGAELIFLDSFRDRLPDVDGLYIGGGFPELFLEELEDNYKLRGDIAEAAKDGLPVYAECAGLMYLCRAILFQGGRHEMVGVIDAEVEICRRPQGHGYVEVEVSAENPLFPIGLTIRGHEFHHSRLLDLGGLKFAYKVRRGHGINGRVDGIVYKNVLASYIHLHALGTPQWAGAFISLAANRCGLYSSGSKI